MPERNYNAPLGQSVTVESLPATVTWVDGASAPLVRLALDTGAGATPFRVCAAEITLAPHPHFRRVSKKMIQLSSNLSRPSLAEIRLTLYMDAVHTNAQNLVSEWNPDGWLPLASTPSPSEPSCTSATTSLQAAHYAGIPI